MTAAKKPADGQVVVEFEGVTLTFDKEDADDLELIDLLMGAEEDPRAGFAAARRLVGDEQWLAALDKLRVGERIPFTKTIELTKAILGPLGELVGSLAS